MHSVPSNIARGDLEFGLIFNVSGHCETGYSLSGKIQRVERDDDRLAQGAVIKPLEMIP
jgi:hypothetical protein